MKNANHDHVIGIPVSCVSCAAKELLREPASVPESDSPYLHYKEDKKESVVDWTSKFSKKADSYVQGIREHVSLGPKISETLKGKLSLGARILQAGGIERVFRQAFPVSKGEKLVKASQCYLSTTAGPIAGMLFISTEKIAFHSDRSLTLTSPKGDLARIPYKAASLLLGLDKYGKGDWRSIARNFVISRTPIQVASHAQKYFIRLNSMNEDRRRANIHIPSAGNNEDISAPQGPITGQANGPAANPGGKSARPSSQPLPGPPGVGVFGTTIGLPVGGPLVSPVGTPVNLPAPAGPHLAYGVRAPAARPINPGAAMTVPPMTYPMPRTFAQR